MSKTVLLPDELHKQIQDTKIEINWVEIQMSLAKKINHFYKLFEFRILQQKDVWTIWTRTK